MDISCDKIDFGVGKIGPRCTKLFFYRHLKVKRGHTPERLLLGGTAPPPYRSDKQKLLSLNFSNFS